MPDERGFSLGDAVDAAKRDYGLSDEAWAMYRAQVERADEAEDRLRRALAELEELWAAFIIHRTTTHEVDPSRCKTCSGSDVAIGSAAALLAELKRGDDR